MNGAQAGWGCADCVEDRVWRAAVAVSVVRKRTTGAVATWLGIHRSTALRWLRLAEQIGLVEQVDRGCWRTSLELVYGANTAHDFRTPSEEPL